MNCRTTVKGVTSSAIRISEREESMEEIIESVMTESFPKLIPDDTGSSEKQKAG
jgi:hypothetical protein